jgi:hypothetical protein
VGLTCGTVLGKQAAVKAARCQGFLVVAEKVGPKLLAEACTTPRLKEDCRARGQEAGLESLRLLAHERRQRVVELLEAGRGPVSVLCKVL